MKTRGLILPVLLATMVLLTGCWNRRELSELATVIAMGIDKVPETNEYRVSFQIVNPGTVAGGMTGGGGQAIAPPVAVYSENGATLFEAIRKSSQVSPRRLFFAHVRVVVIGESFARKGIRELFDMFERSHETRLTSRVVVARGSSAEQVVKTLTPLDKIPSNSIVGKLMFSQGVWSESIRTEIDEVIRSQVSEGRELALSGVRIIGKPEEGGKMSNLEHTRPLAALQVYGIGLFKKGKLLRWMDEGDARGLVWIRNKMKGTIVNVDCGEKKDAIGIEVTGAKTEIRSRMQEGKPAFQIVIRQEGNVGEVNCSVDLSKTGELKKQEQKWSDKTKTEVMSAVRIAQRRKSDIFGFGEAVNRQHKKAWETLKKDWNNTFAESKVEVTVESFLRRSGMRLKPYLLKEDDITETKE